MFLKLPLSGVSVPDQIPGGLGTDLSYRELHSLMIDGGDRFGVSAVAFDQQEELFWVGNQGVSYIYRMTKTKQNKSTLQVLGNPKGITCF